ncbi:hypothetical protein TTHERM_00099850 (macronuclear) [Tetrahymena thermophila SB210]|uniref:Uncharacterized protein n=1 Tax=Tetrahymena thermophila (strain SB210) TaxID=312017 RepID=Q234W5_TETTS|nr:hypothetical protein TTHERM_00099850 [Tetrahymena thermophila SB210]EAR91888.1 hypothetical protein TTHERM_00099850 [Tetrahymena thermophila SB210]|eukprot:XP_001012133.1 hypothetical protein TTHERM_00099850 [Tetrahymena thermophila SB210]
MQDNLKYDEENTFQRGVFELKIKQTIIKCNRNMQDNLKYDEENAFLRELNEKEVCKIIQNR